MAAQAPGVVADLFRAQAAVAVQHLEGHVRVDLQVQAWTLQLLQAAKKKRQKERKKQTHGYSRHKLAVGTRLGQQLTESLDITLP